MYLSRYAADIEMLTYLPVCSAETGNSKLDVPCVDPDGLFALLSLIQHVILRKRSALSVAMTMLALIREAAGDHLTGGLFSNMKYLCGKVFQLNKLALIAAV